MQVVKASTVGQNGKHLKLRLKGAKETDPWIDGIAWRRGNEIEQFSEGTRVDLVYTLSKSEWQGRIALSLTIEDLKIVD
jgi:hypothetical protein